MKIKRGNVVRCFVVVGLLLTVFGFHQVARAEAEVINNFNVNIAIQKDGAVSITEGIIYNFGSNQKHGIFRNIPVTAANGPRLDINVSGVSNEFGQPYQYTVAINDDVLQIKIGDPDKLISGVKTYLISYRVYNAIRTFSDHDELYWNVTGNQWPVAIQNTGASVALPDPAIPNVRMDCFTGLQGAAQKNCTFQQEDSNISYATTQSLNINEGLTIVLGIPLGYIQNIYVPPPRSYAAAKTLGNNLARLFFLAISVIFILVIIRLFTRRAQKVKPKPVIPNELKSQPVVVEYNPPDNLPPVEVGALLDRRVDIADISSVIMDLAIRGYIKIRYTVQEIRFWPDKKDFELVKLKSGSNLAHPADKIIFNLLFRGRNSVKLSDLKEQDTTFQADIEKIKKHTEQHLQKEGYFQRAPENIFKKMKTYLTVAAVILLSGFFISYWIFSSGPRFVFMILLIAILMIGAAVAFSIMSIRPARELTPKGIAALGKILGFREFLRLTEKDKLRLLNAPELQPEMFEKFLPYAMVLGVENKWAQKFEGIYKTIPNWYEDPTVTSFNSFTLTRNLALFNSSFNQVFNITSPQSSSGLGGGGFSGGGSGGGGGGSW